MSKGRWYGEPLKKTSCTLPLSIYKAAKRAKLDFSRHLRIALLKTLKQGDEITTYFNQISQENAGLKQRLKIQSESIWELRQKIEDLDEELKKVKR